MSDTTDELSKKAVSNEEEIISEILSHQKIGDTENENDVSVCANCGKEGSVGNGSKRSNIMWASVRRAHKHKPTYTYAQAVAGQTATNE